MSQTRHLCGVRPQSGATPVTSEKSPLLASDTLESVSVSHFNKQAVKHAGVENERLSDMSAAAEEAALNMNTTAVITHQDVVSAQKYLVRANRLEVQLKADVSKTIFIKTNQFPRDLDSRWEK